MEETTINITSILNILGVSIPDLVPPNLPEPIEIPDDLEIELVEISGKLIGEDTREPLSNVRIFSPFKIPTKTDSNGEFTLKVPNISKTPFSPSKFQINVLGKIRQYSPIKITPYLSNKEVKPNLGIIPLTSIKSNLAEEIADLLTFEDREVEEYSTTDVTFEFWVEKNLSKAIKDLKKQVIPLILGLVAQYGISKVKEKLEQVKANKGKLTEDIIQQITCPTSDTLDQIITTQNKLVTKINNTFTQVNKTNESIQISNDGIQSTDATYQALKNVPIPTSIGGIPIDGRVILAVQDIKNLLNGNIGRLSQGNSALASILGILTNTLSQVLDFLTFLDLVNQYCSQSSLDTVQQNLLDENRKYLQQQSISPVTPIELNGFNFGVETENTTSDLKRKRAVAKNKQGVILLRGEYSFSSTDQILIDELVFYIQNNDLKAN